jgi:hypothetical protein
MSRFNGYRAHSARRAQAFTTLKDKMEELGTVVVEDSAFFTVFNERNTAGAGVYVKGMGTQVKAKVVLERSDVEHLLPTRIRIGRRQSMTVPYLDGSGRFTVKVRTEVNSRRHGHICLVIYEHDGTFNEEIMRKCVSLVAAAFNH